MLAGTLSTADVFSGRGKRSLLSWVSTGAVFEVVRKTLFGLLIHTWHAVYDLDRVLRLRNGSFAERWGAQRRKREILSTWASVGRDDGDSSGHQPEVSGK